MGRTQARRLGVSRPQAWVDLIRLRGMLGIFNEIAVRPRLAIVLASTLAGLFCAVGTLWVEPVPAVHDEFSHLLAADTFSSGRLFNATHPMWEHFESIHIIHRPVYASKYLPAQGLLLALGQVTTGRPIVGAWIGVALATGACVWMLQGWLPRRWALLGGVLLATHPYIVGDWGHGYWGGALAAAGGAFVYGALPRLMERYARRDSLMLGLGLVLLATTRPFEGFFLSVPACLWLVWTAFGFNARPRRRMLDLLAPVAIVCFGAMALMLHYNASLTGDPLKLPYQIHEQTYAATPSLVWQELRPPVQYRHEVIRAFWNDWAPRAYLTAQSPAGFITTLALKLGHLASYYLATPLAALLVLVPLAVWRSRTKFAVIVLACVLLLVAVAQVSWIYVAHYVAPGLALFLLLFLQAARHARCWRWDSLRVGRWLFRALVLGHIAVSLVLWPEFLRKPQWAQERARIVRQLSRMGGQHLVVVRYGQAHDVHAEWVYNAADIDGAEVVWARSMGDARDARLAAYFDSRTLWSLHPDDVPFRLERRRP